MPRIGVVGAGVAAAGLCYAVGADRPDATVTALEKSDGVSGRAATRHRGDVVYDYGANYLKSDDDRVSDLVAETLSAGLVDVADPVWTFDAGGTVSPGRGGDEPKWTYRGGIDELAGRLFAETDATIHHRTRVEQVSRTGDGWRLRDDAGRTWGPFDAVALSPPAPQTAALLRGTDAVEDLATAAEAVPYRSIWTAALHYPFALDRPYYALVNTDKDHDVGWIGREKCKPGHVPAGESLLIVQANHEWSVAHRDRPAGNNVEGLARITASLLDDDRLADPDWTDHQHWRYALPDAGVDPDPLRAAEAAGLFCVGDWVAGEARLHAALRNGIETGERLVGHLDE